jgi:hypothetical protein
MSVVKSCDVKLGLASLEHHESETSSHVLGTPSKMFQMSSK